MPQADAKQPVPIVSACMRADGSPTFAHQVVEVTSQEADNGIHYYLAEAELLEKGYEEPFVHFAMNESPPFLHEAVRQYLGLSAAAAKPSPMATFSEDS